MLATLRDDCPTNFLANFITGTNADFTTMTPEERFNVVVNHAFGGWHHVQNRMPFGAGVTFSYLGDMSTIDGDAITRIALAAHAVRVRVELRPGGHRAFKVIMFCREDKPDSWWKHHPSIDDLIAAATKLKV